LKRYFATCFSCEFSLFILFVSAQFLSHFNFTVMNLYVSNLGFHVSDDDLMNLFSAYGSVTSAKVITDRETGRSRGFGFVEMQSEEEGKKAIAGLEGKEVEGRSISVSVARPKSDNRNSFGGGGGGNRGGGGYGGGGGNRGGRW
jgi:RNA recognition motif-containing protein